MMWKKLMWTAVLASALVGCEDIQGNGNIVEQERSAGAFSGVNLAEGLHGEIAVGPQASVKIRGDSNLLEFIRLESKNNVLTSDLEKGLSLLPSEPIVVTIVTPTLTEVVVSNGSHVNARGIDTEKLTLRVSGRSELSVSGTAENLTLVAASGSELQARELPVKVASVDASGASQVTVHVTEAISGSVTGSSDVTVHGHPPQSDLPASGGSKVLFE